MATGLLLGLTVAIAVADPPASPRSETTTAGPARVSENGPAIVPRANASAPRPEAMPSAQDASAALADSVKVTGARDSVWLVPAESTNVPEHVPGACTCCSTVWGLRVSVGANVADPASEQLPENVLARV